MHLCVTDAFYPFADITMQDQMVIYDNEKAQLGWIRGSCSRSPKSIMSSFPWSSLTFEPWAGHPLNHNWMYHWWSWKKLLLASSHQYCVSEEWQSVAIQIKSVLLNTYGWRNKTKGEKDEHVIEADNKALTCILLFMVNNHVPFIWNQNFGCK